MVMQGGGRTGRQTLRVHLGRLARCARATAAVVAVVFAAFAGVGCGGSSRAEDELVILSPHWEGIQQEFERGFKEHWKATTGRTVDITWLDQGGTSQILRFIRSEYKQDSTGIDVDMMFGGGIDPYFTLQSEGFTEPYLLPDSILSRIPREFAGVPLYDSTGHWYGATLSGFGIIYNSAVARLQDDQVPMTWEAMGDPRLFGWISSGEPRMSGSVHMVYEIILQAYGWERGWQVVTAMAANSTSFARNSAQVPLAVARGDAIAGMSIDFYAWSEVSHMATDDLGFVYPENLTAVNPDAICILRGARHRELARAFLRFVMGEAGQRIWAFKRGAPGGPVQSQLNRFSVMPDLYRRHPDDIAVKINPFAWKMTFRYDSDRGSKRWSVLNDLVGTLLIDSHAELVGAWETVRRAGEAREGLAALARPPVSEARAMALAGKWSDQALRNAVINEWTVFARRKYAAVRSGRYGSSVATQAADAGPVRAAGR